jgi:hypothetical protein
VSSNQIEKTILVLSDSELLFNIIWANLRQSHLKIYRCNPTEGAIRALPKNGHSKNTKIDLIIVANSSRSTEPVVTLAEAALAAQIGHIPLLIISDRNFVVSQKQQIFHLDFPFEPEALCHKVQTLLNHDCT